MRRLILIRTPKAGSSSLTQVFRKRHDALVTSRRRKLKPQLEPALRTRQAVVISGGLVHRELVPILDELPEGTLVVGCMRSPYSRFVSAWKFLDKNGRYPQPADVTRHDRGDDDGPWAWWHAMRPQCHNLYSHDGRLLVNRVLAQETLQADYEALCEEMGWQPHPLGHANRGRYGDDWRAFYRRRKHLRRRVEKSFPLDTYVLPYEFEDDEPWTHDLPDQLPEEYRRGPA